RHCACRLHGWTLSEVVGVARAPSAVTAGDASATLGCTFSAVRLCACAAIRPGFQSAVECVGGESVFRGGPAPEPGVYDARQMRYELFMSHALSEASEAAARGERPDGAVAVKDDAMVASAANQVNRTGDPTAHAVVATIREAAQRLGRPSLAGM